MIPGWWNRHRGALTVAAVALVAVLAFAAIHRLIATIRFADVRAAVERIGLARLVAALALTACSYLALTAYDVLALRAIGRPLPWPTAALASFTSYTLSHNLGLSLLTGGSVRMRIYTRAGLRPGEVAQVILLASLAFWGGVVLLAGTALLLRHRSLDVAGLLVPTTTQHLVGALLVVGCAALLLLGGRRGKAVTVLGWTLPLAPAPVALAQVGIAVIDLAAATAALFMLVPGLAAHAFPLFFLAYALAMIVALVTHVPGGIGVFEAVLLALGPSDKAALLAAVIAYRIIYYLIPLGAALAILILREGRNVARPIARGVGVARGIASAVAPTALSLLAFAAGCVLLASSALPALPERLHLLSGIIPLSLIEASHLGTSLIGTILLLLAPGLYRRLDGAAWLASILLMAGAILSLAKGLDYEEASILTAVAALLHWLRPAFYRRTRLTAETLSGGWLTAAALSIAASVWIGLFAYRHVAYQDSLWWRFALHADSSRFLRASLVASATLVTLSLWHLLRAPTASAGRRAIDPATLASALGYATRTDAMLALTGDKSFVEAPSGEAFAMYGVAGKTWVVMGDPVGRPEEWPALLWQMRAAADAGSGHLLLYEISPQSLGLAVELGLAIIKFGEEAVVELPGFDLATPALRSVRRASRHAAKAGAAFRVVAAAEVPALLPRLRGVSDEWLRAKDGREKSFSLGAFDEDYLSKFDCALVERDGEILAFANVWKTAGRQELSVDLMRHRSDIPQGTMDLLFAGLMEWGREAGYARFSLGMAPLTGIDARALAPRWAKVLAFLSQHGERFYGFRGLRAYKAKFNPVWEPRYLAGPPGLAMMAALIDLSRLIGRERAEPLPQPNRNVSCPSPQRMAAAAI
ncbi:bifunctional lysylphosphatidylglycerol flippase/synthetase MprF [Sphingomonas rosea]|uniref:Bifunctional lysylphosphatidylglycerol flippase/synthetase MprF n=1 Tax=Sphingomonas rosea TaxID=335605 RepID=A0ABP7U711_9SPHN